MEEQKKCKYAYRAEILGGLRLRKHPGTFMILARLPDKCRVVVLVVADHASDSHLAGLQPVNEALHGLNAPARAVDVVSDRLEERSTLVENSLGDAPPGTSVAIVSAQHDLDIGTRLRVQSRGRLGS